LQLPIGVHLNLSEGMPLRGSIAGLTSSSGAFPGKAELRRFLGGGEFDPAPLHRELAAQIEKVLAAGLIPDHLDSHQHFSLFPVATTLLIDLAREYAIPALRLSVPVEPPLADPDGELGADLALYRRLAPAFTAQVWSSGLVAPDGLFGMPLLNRLNQETLLAILCSLPAGTWELMVHPGYPDGNSPFSGAARYTELVALTAPAAADTLCRYGILSTNFRELACGF